MKCGQIKLLPYKAVIVFFFYRLLINVPRFYETYFIIKIGDLSFSIWCILWQIWETFYPPLAAWEVSKIGYIWFVNHQTLSSYFIGINSLYVTSTCLKCALVTLYHLPVISLLISGGYLFCICNLATLSLTSG